MTMTYKREFRELSPETKEKISAYNRGKKKSEYTKQLISQSMIEYWQTVPHRPDNNGSQTLSNEEK